MHNITGSSGNGNQAMAERLYSLNTDGPDGGGQAQLGGGIDINPADGSPTQPRPSPHPDSQTSTERLAQGPTASEQLASSPTTTDTLSDQSDPVNVSPLTGPSAMLARREFSQAPFTLRGPIRPIAI